MALNFDFDENNYDLGSPVRAMALQNEVIKFMNIVRTNETLLEGANEHWLQKFMDFVDNKDAWPLVMKVVPEFQIPQDEDVSGKSALGLLLRALKHRRPSSRPGFDPEVTAEKKMVRQRLRDSYQYVMSLGTREVASPEEEEEIGNLVDGLATMIEEEENAAAGSAVTQAS